MTIEEAPAATTTASTSTMQMGETESYKYRMFVFLADMMAGGVSGAVSKTIAAPLERVKLLMQTQHLNPALQRNPYSSPLNCFRRIYREEGLRSFWRGNMASVYRFFPNHALNFAFKDQYKRIFVVPLDSQLHFQKKVLDNILAGAVAGGMALLVCHPFDVARTKYVFPLVLP